MPGLDQQLVRRESLEHHHNIERMCFKCCTSTLCHHHHITRDICRADSSRVARRSKTHGFDGDIEESDLPFVTYLKSGLNQDLSLFSSFPCISSNRTLTSHGQETVETRAVLLQPTTEGNWSLLKHTFPIPHAVNVGHLHLARFPDPVPDANLAHEPR